MCQRSKPVRTLQNLPNTLLFSTIVLIKVDIYDVKYTLCMPRVGINSIYLEVDDPHIKNFRESGDYG